MGNAVKSMKREVVILERGVAMFNVGHQVCERRF
jgi:hypothetical protein